MKLKIFKLLYYIGLILTFFTQLVVFFIPKSGFLVPTGGIIWIALPLLLFVASYKKIFNFYKSLLKIPITKIYLLLILYFVINIIVNIFLGQYRAPIGVYYVRMQRIIVNIVFLYLFIPLCTFLNIKLKTIIKIFYGVVYFILTFAILEYLSLVLNFTGFKLIQGIITNMAQLAPDHLQNCYDATMRVKSILQEPSMLGQFIFVFLPFAININFTKYRLYENIYLNFIVKKSFLVLILLTLIYTKSPIFLVLTIIELIILLLLEKRIWIKQNLIYIVSFFIITSFIIAIITVYTLDSFTFNTESYLERIDTTLQCLGSLNTLVEKEPSLATRITAYAHQFVVFLQHSLLGVGMCNAEIAANKIMIYTNIPITPEILRGYYQRTYSVWLNKSFVFTGLAEFGLVGAFIYISFVIKNLKFLKVITCKLTEINYVFCYSLMQSIVMLLIISFYNLPYDYQIVWLLYGLILTLTIYVKKGYNND